MLGRRGMQLMTQRKLRQLDVRTTRHPGSKRPGQRGYRAGEPGVRHNRAIRNFNEWCYERGLLGAVRNDFR